MFFSAAHFAVSQQANQFLILGCCFIHVPPCARFVNFKGPVLAPRRPNGIQLERNHYISRYWTRFCLSANQKPGLIYKSLFQNWSHMQNAPAAPRSANGRAFTAAWPNSQRMNCQTWKPATSYGNLAMMPLRAPWRYQNSAALRESRPIQKVHVP